jgi:hypothetical protein
MTDHTADIDGLLGYLSLCVENRYPLMPRCVASDYYAALDALVAERDALAAEIAALKPKSNADEFASIPLRSWVVEVFQHLCHSPHTPDEWKRDLDKKTIALLNAIEQGKKEER